MERQESDMNIQLNIRKRMHELDKEQGVYSVRCFCENCRVMDEIEIPLMVEVVNFPCPSCEVDSLRPVNSDASVVVDSQGNVRILSSDK